MHVLELQLVKGLCQKYTACLGCHSTFAYFIHGGVAVISDTVILICMSFISLRIFSKRFCVL